jgi:hypothetical protein
LRQNFGFGLYLWALFTLASANDLEPVIGWHGWMMVGWALLKIGFLGYAGFLLLDAHEEITRLTHSNKVLEQIIGEISSRPNSPETQL